jgi:anti-sigma factor RsiW
MSLDDSQLSARLRRDATRHAAPAALRAQIVAQVALEEAGRSSQAPRSDAAQTPRRAFGFVLPSLRWRNAMAGFALGVACTLVAVPLVQRVGVHGPLEADLVANHVQALRVGPLMQVVSTDRHTVKPWFQGRIDYAPPVIDLAAQAFPLKGGRVDELRGQRVAALAYSRDLHIIDLFVWPADATAAPVRTAYRGFNVVQWADGTMQYWAVSDVEGTELDRFAQLWQQARAQIR